MKAALPYVVSRVRRRRFLLHRLVFDRLNDYYGKYRSRPVRYPIEFPED